MTEAPTGTMFHPRPLPHKDVVERETSGGLHADRSSASAFCEQQLLRSIKREVNSMNVTRRWRRLVLGLIVFYVTVGGLAPGVWGAEATRFLVSYGGTAGYQLPLWVNKELGFSKKYGVDLEIVLIQAGSPNIQALLGGSLQLTQTAASSAIIDAARGAPVVIVATLENKLPLQLISRPEIREPQQLRGKVIGINRFGGSNDAAVLMALKAWKMQPS